MKLTVAHSPDPDDAFMFYALAKNKIETDGIEFEHHLHDIETLNNLAGRETYDITALSTHGWFYVQDKYTLLECGASVGNNYGPIIVSSIPTTMNDLQHMKIGIPGLRTTATLLLKLAIKNPKTEAMPFDKIIQAVLDKTIDAGLIIHEGQLTHPNYKLFKVVDLGAWWFEKTKLPVVLGILATKKNLDAESINDLITRSIKYSLAHHDEALDYALQFGRGIPRQTGNEFVSMYVNDETIELSNQSRKSIEILRQEFYKIGAQ